MTKNYADLIDDVKDDQEALKKEFIEMEMKEINYSKEHGYRWASWYFWKEKYQAIIPQMAELFESKGYRIRPTGYIDGVWQRTQRICW